MTLEELEFFARAGVWVPMPAPGQGIRVDGKTWRRTSACIARQRLRDVVAQDRAAVPCGRWVKLRPDFSRLHAWAMQNWLCGGYSSKPAPVMDRRQRYRWEVRR